MIPKSGNRFSEKIMLKQKKERDDRVITPRQSPAPDGRRRQGYRASIMRKVGARNAADLLCRVLSQDRTA